eukprot:g28879.t1
MCPSYACLFVGNVELKRDCKYTGIVPQLFCHYIDDCIGPASCTQDELEQFTDFANNFHPALKFTWTISDTSLTFLDLSVSTSGNVYCIWCSQYRLLDTGETKRRLRGSFAEHVRLARNSQPNFQVTTHFNSTHSSTDMSILDLLQYRSESDCKFKEHHLIF